MNYAIILLKHLSARLIINGWFPVEDRQMRWTSHQIGFFSISLLFNSLVYHFACRLFSMTGSYTVGCFVLLDRMPARRSWVECAVALSDDVKWQPEIWKVILSFIVCFYLHIFYFFFCLLIRKRQIQIWPEQTVRLGAVLGACRVSESTLKCNPALRNCQWKCYHQINLSWASWDMGLGARINTDKKYTTPGSFDRTLVQNGQI